MPTAASSPEAPAGLADVRRAVADVGHLLRFRSSGVRRRAGLVLLVAVVVALTAAAAWVPAHVASAGERGAAADALVLVPTALAGFLLVAVVSAIASAGGRELLSREHAVAFPVSPTTDHVGALLLAPLNLAWLVQGWVLLGAMAFALGPDGLLPAQLGVLLWLGAATAVAQAVAWSVEWVRRGPHGVALVRAVAVGLGLLAAGLQLGGHLAAALDRLPTRVLVVGLVDGWTVRWFVTAGVELAIMLGAVVLGGLAAHAAARRTPRDEQRAETRRHAVRGAPRSDLAALVRLDRASAWRAVPMRRGLAVLAVGPGAVALAGAVPWSSMTILPGLVVSGGALVFGVNAWCLDGRGALWRESLPVAPATVFTARVVVLAEFLIAASGASLLLASLRAGAPTAAEVSALLCIWVVVLVQVLGASMRFSDQRPYAVDLRSSRASPAPPLLMVGYSARLAVSTTLTSLVFSGLSRQPLWELSLLAAVPLLAWSLLRLRRTRARWLAPHDRARVVAAVAA